MKSLTTSLRDTVKNSKEQIGRRFFEWNLPRMIGATTAIKDMINIDVIEKRNVLLIAPNYVLQEFKGDYWKPYLSKINVNNISAIDLYGLNEFDVVYIDNWVYYLNKPYRDILKDILYNSLLKSDGHIIVLNTTEGQLL